MADADAQTVPLVVRRITAIFRRSGPADYESVMPPANSVSASAGGSMCSSGASAGAADMRVAAHGDTAGD